MLGPCSRATEPFGGVGCYVAAGLESRYRIPRIASNWATEQVLELGYFHAQVLVKIWAAPGSRRSMLMRPPSLR